MKNVISPLSQGLCTPDLGGWWLRIREPHPQSHLTDQPLGHVTTQRRYVFTFISIGIPNLGTSYSVVITIEVCAEGNWLIQVSAYFYPS